MLILLRHENMPGRPVAVYTFTLIAIHIAAFLLTLGPMESQQPKRFQVQLRLLALAAKHPELQWSREANVYVETVKKQRGDNWARTRATIKADVAQTGAIAKLRSEVPQFDRQPNTDAGLADVKVALSRTGAFLRGRPVTRAITFNYHYIGYASRFRLRLAHRPDRNRHSRRCIG